MKNLTINELFLLILITSFLFYLVASTNNYAYMTIFFFFFFVCLFLCFMLINLVSIRSVILLWYSRSLVVLYVILLQYSSVLHYYKNYQYGVNYNYIIYPTIFTTLNISTFINQTYHISTYYHVVKVNMAFFELPKSYESVINVNPSLIVVLSLVSLLYIYIIAKASSIKN